MRKKSLIFGFEHFLVDYLSLFPFVFLGKGGNSLLYEDDGFALFSLASYVVFAFLLQGPIGLLLDDKKGKWDNLFLSLSLPFILSGGILGILVSSVLPFSSFQPLFVFLFIPLFGLGNAFFHVASGKKLLDNGAKSCDLGIFISFGSLAVALTSPDFAALKSSSFSPFLLLSILYGFSLFIGFLLLPYLLKTSVNIEENSSHPSFSYSFIEGAIFLLLIGISVFLRGFIGSYHASSSPTYAFLIVSLAIFFGKFLGGFIVDYLGTGFLLILSILFTVVGYSLKMFDNPIPMNFFMAFSINLFMGLTLSLSGEVSFKSKGFAFGILSTFLGFASFAGSYVSSLISLPYLNLILSVPNFLLIFFVLFFLGRKKKKKYKEIFFGGSLMNIRRSIHDESL